MGALVGGLWATFLSVLCLACIGSVTARDAPKFECENSGAGRHNIVDSSGYVCPRSQVDYFTGCCANGTVHDCETCHTEDKCCSSYEHCVSCCLRPDFNATALVKEQFRIHEHPNTGKWENPFQFCMGKCRTHQLSTEHENSFIDDRHFCFSDSGRPKTAQGLRPIPEHVTVAVSEQGADCAATCAERSQVCSQEHLATVSQCDILRDHFDCEAGCYPVQGEMAEHAPAYVVYGTPKPQFPTLCFIPKEDSAPSCTASQPHLFRLCACVAPAAGELLTDTIGSDSASGEDMVDEQAVQDAHEKLAKEMVARGSVAKKQSAEDQRATEDVADAPEEHAEPDDGT